MATKKKKAARKKASPRKAARKGARALRTMDPGEREAEPWPSVDADAAGAALAPLPAGVILPWYSTNGTVPSGWGLCDGNLWEASDGTFYKVPNLIDKFLRGATSTMDANTPENEVPGADTHRHGGVTTGRVNPMMVHYTSGNNRNGLRQHEHAIKPDSSVPRHWRVMFIISLP